MEISAIMPANVAPTSGYSHAVRLGNLVFVAGQVGVNEKGELVAKGDVRAQAERAYENLRTVLEAAGSGLDLVGKITVYATSREYVPILRDVRKNLFAPVGHLPASTFVVVSGLAHPDYLVEVEAVAAVRDS